MLEKPACRRTAQGLREGHGPPLRTMANVAAKRVAVTPRGSRRAGCPHPAGPRGGSNVSVLKLPWRGGRERPPYKFGKTRRPPRRIHAAARFPGRIWNPPLQPTAGLQPPVKSRTPHCCNLCRGHKHPTNHGKRCGQKGCRHPPGGRRAGCPHPARPRGGANVSILKLPWCGGRERPPYVAGRPLRLTGNPCAAATSVGADARIGPGNPTPPQTPAGGPWPSPADHGIRPGGTPRPVSNIAVSKR